MKRFRWTWNIETARMIEDHDREISRYEMAVRRNNWQTYREGTQLRLLERPINASQAQEMFTQLRKDTNLRGITLSDNLMGPNEMRYFAYLLRDNPGIKEFMLNNNEIELEGAKQLGEVLKSNSSLTELALESDYLGDQGAAAIADGLKSNSTLRKLSLSGNGIRSVGAIAIAEALKSNAKLESLNLGYNSLDDDAAKALAEALGVNSTLKYLDVSKNSIREEGASALLDTLRKNSNLSLWIREQRLFLDEHLDEPEIKFMRKNEDFGLQRFRIERSLEVLKGEFDKPRPEITPESFVASLDRVENRINELRNEGYDEKKLEILDGLQATLDTLRDDFNQEMNQSQSRP